MVDKNKLSLFYEYFIYFAMAIGIIGTLVGYILDLLTTLNFIIVMILFIGTGVVQRYIHILEEREQLANT